MYNKRAFFNQSLSCVPFISKGEKVDIFRVSLHVYFYTNKYRFDACNDDYCMYYCIITSNIYTSCD